VLKVRRLRGEQGNALVEFALAITVLLTLLFGIIDIGRALYAYDWLYNSARQATRWAMVRGYFCNNLLPGCPADKTAISNYVTNSNGSGLDTTGIDTSAVNVSSLCYVTNTPASNPPCAPPAWIQIQVRYQFHFITPFLTNTPWTMTSSSQRVVQ
jgi:Flp pilus assembly protein TadG